MPPISAKLLLAMMSLATCLSGCRLDPNTLIAPAATESNQGSLSSVYHACQSQFYQHVEPAISEKLAKNSYPLCFNGFAVRYSGITKTPIWVTQYLTRQRLSAAKALVRDDSFHEESRLPDNVRSTLNDYNHSGYDRGHLAPNADMGSKDSQYGSFSLANIAPQYPAHNRKTWVKVEKYNRDLVNKYGASYVVTGVAYLTPQVKQLNHNVFVPSHFYKAIYIPSIQQGLALISANNDSDKVESISLSELQQRTGVDAFPNLSSTVKSTMLAN